MARPTQIESLRRQIAALQAERLDLSSQTRSRTEVAALVDRMVSNWATTGLQGVARDLMRVANGEAAEPLTLRGAAPVAAAPGVAQFNLNLGPLLCTLMGAEAVKAALQGALATLPEGTDRAARLERLEAIAAELDRLETEEEAMVEAAGGAIERRPDARPEIILGVL